MARRYELMTGVGMNVTRFFLPSFVCSTRDSGMLDRAVRWRSITRVTANVAFAAGCKQAHKWGKAEVGG